MPKTDDALPDGNPSSIVRRAPFADSPFVGERGHQAQSRILDAALEVFGEVGYQRCGVKRITELSGYSRASFYQYFSSKEDLFRHLAGRVARELRESAEALDPITADLAGWQSFHDWLERYSAIYEANRAVFVTFHTAVASDEMVASGVAVVSARSFKDLRGKIVGSRLPPADVDAVIRILLGTVGRLHRETELLEQVAPRSTLNRKRINIAYVDAFHRALFGTDPAVNVHTSSKPLKALARTPRSASGDGPSADDGHGPAAQRTRNLLIESGHKVFVERGYYATRVADIVKEAGVSHGVFYRYFDNKSGLFAILAERATARVAEAFDRMPDLTDADGTDVHAALREWLGLYASTSAAEASIFAMWSEAMSRDDDLGAVSASVIDGSRARLARHLEPRGWGDPDADGMVFLSFLDGMTSHRVSPTSIEHVARMIERGLLVGPEGTAADGRRPKQAAAPKTKSARANPTR